MLPLQLIPAASAVVAPLVERLADRLEQPFHSFFAAARQTPAEDSQTASDAVTPAEGLQPLASDEHLRELARQELSQFLELLDEKLSAGGISDPATFELKFSNSGKVRVDGNHPNRSEIESLFETDPELTHQFRRAAAAVTAHRRFIDHEGTAGRDLLLEFNAGTAVSVRFE